MNQEVDLLAQNFVRVPCRHCNGNIEFDANQLEDGQKLFIACPHCGKDTEISAPEKPPLAPQSDDPKIAKWFREAVNGDCQAQWNIGYAFWSGEDIPQDYAEAYKWFRKAAEQESNSAQWFVGVAHANGLGVQQNYEEACKWWTKAAKRGDQFSQHSLAQAYHEGQGVQKSYSEALKWFKRAAEQGDDSSQFWLGIMFREGQGAQKDPLESFKWFRRAAEQGNIHAQFILSLAFAQGIGAPQDFIEAYKWANLAAAGGTQEAQNLRDDLAGQLDEWQIAEGQRRSFEFQPIPENYSAPPELMHHSRRDENTRSSGTGFFITDDGYFISNNHVVKDAAKIRIVTGSGTIDSKVIQTDAANDLALLKAEGKFASLPIISSRGVKLGSAVATMGFPNPGLQGFAPKLAKGEIAALSGAGDDARYFQISAPVQPGNSGGALVDAAGNVVGIVSAKLDAATALAASGALPENVNYAVKSSFLLSFLESVPGVEAKLKKPNTTDEKFEDVVKSAQDAAVLVLVY